MENSNNIGSEEDLIRRLKARDVKALSELYDNYSPALYGIILRVINNEALAQDALQEVFVKIWSKIDLYDRKKGKLFTWMLNIARNSAIDVVNSAKYKQASKTQTLDTSVYKLGSSDLHIDQIGVKKLVEDLPEEHRVLLDLIYFQGFTHKEAAEKLELPLGTVKTRVRAALKRLRKRFN